MRDERIRKPRQTCPEPKLLRRTPKVEKHSLPDPLKLGREVVLPTARWSGLRRHAKRRHSGVTLQSGIQPDQTKKQKELRKFVKFADTSTPITHHASRVARLTSRSA